MGREEQQNGSSEGVWSARILPQLPGSDACAEAAGGDGGGCQPCGSLEGCILVFLLCDIT